MNCICLPESSICPTIMRIFWQAFVCSKCSNFFTVIPWPPLFPFTLYLCPYIAVFIIIFSHLKVKCLHFICSQWRQTFSELYLISLHLIPSISEWPKKFSFSHFFDWNCERELILQDSKQIEHHNSWYLWSSLWCLKMSYLSYYISLKCRYLTLKISYKSFSIQKFLCIQKLKVETFGWWKKIRKKCVPSQSILKSTLPNLQTEIQLSK